MRAAFLVEDVGLGPELQAGAGQAEALRQAGRRRRAPRPRARPRRDRSAPPAPGSPRASRRRARRGPASARRTRRSRRPGARSRSSATQSGTRPANSIAGCAGDVADGSSSVPSASVSSAVACRRAPARDRPSRRRATRAPPRARSCGPPRRSSRSICSRCLTIAALDFVGLGDEDRSARSAM